MPTLVYKVGGSLLSLPDLSFRICRVLAETPGVRPLLVVGGGPTCDLVRTWDRLHHLGDDRAHWLALRSLMLNEALLLELKPECRIVASREEAEEAWDAAHLPIVCAYEFLRREELHTPDGEVLPHTWDVTSDSVAAWIAHRWPADGLVLLKSMPVPNRLTHELAGSPPPDLVASTASGEMPGVDPHFPHLAPRLPRLGWVNLRDEFTPSIDWLSVVAASCRRESSRV